MSLTMPSLATPSSAFRSYATRLSHWIRIGHRLGRFVASLGVGLSAVTLASGIALAGSSDVRFDTMYLVSCRDITAGAAGMSDPQQRLVEARFQVTALPAEGEPAADMQYVYQFLSPTGNLQIVDFQPRTTQTTAIAGTVAIEQSKEGNKSLDASVSGGFHPFVQGTAGADLAEKTLSHIRYELKPPMEVTLVAGTVQRGTGVYFRLLRAADVSWEGSREFIVVMRVPRRWRADLMYLRCEAQQEDQDRVVTRGLSRFVVGLYSEGDDEARAVVEALNLAEVSLRRTAAQRQRDIERRSIPSVVHKLGAMLDIYDPRIPDAWLDQLIYGPTNMQQHEFVDYLPADVRRLADRYAQAKQRLSDYSGKRLAMHEARLPLGMR
jgi:hypothetical protein